MKLSNKNHNRLANWKSPGNNEEAALYKDAPRVGAFRRDGKITVAIIEGEGLTVSPSKPEKERTNSVIERLNRGIRRRTHVVVYFPNENSALNISLYPAVPCGRYPVRATRSA